MFRNVTLGFGWMLMHIIMRCWLLLAFALSRQSMENGPKTADAGSRVLVVWLSEKPDGVVTPGPGVWVCILCGVTPFRSRIMPHTVFESARTSAAHICVTERCLFDLRRCSVAIRRRRKGWNVCTDVDVLFAFEPTTHSSNTLRCAAFYVLSVRMWSWLLFDPYSSECRTRSKCTPVKSGSYRPMDSQSVCLAAIRRMRRPQFVRTMTVSVFCKWHKWLDTKNSAVRSNFPRLLRRSHVLHASLPDVHHRRGDKSLCCGQTEAESGHRWSDAGGGQLERRA